jgi:hypothetical protein
MINLATPFWGGLDEPATASLFPRIEEQVASNIIISEEETRCHTRAMPPLPWP